MTGRLKQRDFASLLSQMKALSEHCWRSSIWINVRERILWILALISLRRIDRMLYSNPLTLVITIRFKAPGIIHPKITEPKLCDWSVPANIYCPSSYSRNPSHRWEIAVQAQKVDIFEPPFIKGVWIAVNVFGGQAVHNASYRVTYSPQIPGWKHSEKTLLPHVVQGIISFDCPKL